MALLEIVAWAFWPIGRAELEVKLKETLPAVVAFCAVMVKVVPLIDWLAVA